MSFCKAQWTQSDYDSLLTKLQTHADQNYKEFLQRLIPGAQNILGVRMPVLRKIAKSIANGNIDEFLAVSKDTYHETVLLEGLVISYSKVQIHKLLGLCQSFIPKIDNWAVCDTFATSLKISDEDKPRFLSFTLEFLSGSEYEKRFVLVILLSKYLTQNNLDLIFNVCGRVEGSYYVKMAVAWLLSFCFIEFSDRTTRFLENCTLDDWTYNKTLQKIVESNKIDTQTKQQIKALKRSNKTANKC